MKKPFYINPCLPLSGQNLPVIIAAEVNIAMLRYRLFPFPLSFRPHLHVFHFLHLLSLIFFLIIIKLPGTYLLQDLPLHLFPFCVSHHHCSYMKMPLFHKKKCIFDSSYDCSVKSLHDLLVWGVKRCGVHVAPQGLTHTDYSPVCTRR